MSHIRFPENDSRPALFMEVVVFFISIGTFTHEEDHQ